MLDARQLGVDERELPVGVAATIDALPEDVELSFQAAA